MVFRAFLCLFALAFYTLRCKPYVFAFREIDLFVVKTKHGIAAVQKLGFVHDHLRKEQCAGREFSVEI